MAKILVCISNSIYIDGKYKIACFYDQFLSSLQEQGNDVLVFIPNIFNRSPFCSKNELKHTYFAKKLNKEISEFNPDLVITFNYATYNKLLDCVSCPIIIWDADFYPLWNQVEFIKKNADRFTFFCFSNFGMEYARDFFNIKENKIFYLPNATSLKSASFDKNINISFIGTYFGSNSHIRRYIQNSSGSKTAQEVLKLIRNDPFITQKQILKSVKIAKNSNELSCFLKINEKFYSSFFSSENRINTINAICDLGLELYGDEGWSSIACTLPSLAICFNKEKVFSAKKNEEIYNRSKICINVNHSQSVKGTPWRICDVMSTSGCLVSEYSPFIDELFKKYVKIPTYNNHYEARELCAKLLKDDVWRKEIVDGSNLAIETEHRWHHRFKQMEEILGIQLIHKDKVGSIKILEPEKTLLERLTNRTFSVKVHKEGKSDKVAKYNNDNMARKRDYFHFRTKIWRGRCIDIEIKKTKPNE